MKYANKSRNKRDRGTSIRALLLMLALVTSIALPTLRPPVSQAQASGTVVGWGTDVSGSGAESPPGKEKVAKICPLWGAVILFKRQGEAPLQKGLNFFT